MFPFVRLRRIRKHPWLRDMVAEARLEASDLILPIFVTEGHNVREPIEKIPGVFRLSIDEVEKEAKEAEKLGIKAIALFPCIEEDLKSDDADEAYNQENLICRAIRHLKHVGLEIGIICDVALDPYTTHGHDGIMVDGEIDNDATLEALMDQALCLAKAGADILAPSDMMDGRVGAIREVLEYDGFTDIAILSYAAKYASSFYAPFRSAVGSGNSLGSSDKKTYQMDIRNSKEAMREVDLDISEGADIVMIKPGLPYLDVIKSASSNFDIPVFAYQVSGEFAMLKFAAEKGALDYEKSLLETLYAFKRAGASAIFTYGALDAARLL